MIGFVAEEVFLKNRFFVHALFAFIFESKHKITVDFRRLINICFRGETFLLLLAVINKPGGKTRKKLKEFRNWRQLKIDQTPQ